MLDVEGKNKLDSYSNYFYGPEKEGWLSYVPHYTDVFIKEIYPEIDLEINLDENGLKYNFIIKPGSDPSLVNVQILNCDSLTVREKEIIIEKGPFTFRDTGLDVFYQEEPNEKINSKFFERSKGVFGFDTEDYDDSRTIVIDPLIYSTFVGGVGDDQASNGKIADDGGFVFCGFTNGNHPTVSGSYDTDHNGGSDVIVCKIDPSGNALVFASYIGGSNNERAQGIVMDGQENIYIGCYTDSTDIPTTDGAYDTSYNGGANDGYIAKIRADGSDLMYASFLGDSGDDLIKAVEIDEMQRPIVVGYSNSPNYPVTNNAYDRTHNGDYDLIITKLDSMGSSLLYSTFYGGTGADYGRDLEWISDNDLVVIGHGDSDDLQMEGVPYDGSQNGGMDVFVIRINGENGDVSYTTYVGGSQDEWLSLYGGSPLSTDESGDVYFTGTTYSANYPTTQYCIDNTYGGTDSGGELGDAFLTKLDGQLKNLLISTYIGGPNGELGNSVNIYRDNSILIAGRAKEGADGIPLTSNAFQSQFGGVMDGWFLKIDPNGNNVDYGTLFCGWTNDVPYQIEYNEKGNIFICGKTASSDFPTTPEAFDSIVNNYDSFILKLIPLMAPSEPRDLEAYAYDSEVILRWKIPALSCSPISGYTIYRGINPNSLDPLERIDNRTYYFDLDAKPSIRYYYRVSATNDYGESYPSNIVDIATGILPSPPLNLTSTESDNAVSLKWEHSIDFGIPLMEEYVIFRGYHVDNMNEIASVATEKNSYADIDVENGRTYLYYVTARSQIGDSGRSNIVVAKPSSYPMPPMLLEAEPGDKQVKLRWSPPESNGGIRIMNYSIKRGEYTTGLLTICELPFGLGEFIDHNLTNGKQLFYAITAWNEKGESSSSNIVAVTPIGPPSRPLNLTANIGDSSIVLIWEQPSDLGGSASVNYNLYRSEQGKEIEYITQTESTVIRDMDLQNGNVYYYYVTAENSEGESEGSNGVFAKPLGVPGNPIDFSVRPGDSFVELNWSAPLSNGGSFISSYRVFRSNDGNEFQRVDRGIGSSLLYNDTEVINGITYSYYVTAVNIIGESKGSATLEATPRGRPMIPSVFSSKSGNGYVALEWDSPLSDGGSSILGYSIYRSGIDGLDIMVAYLPSAARSYNDTDVSNGQTYFYQLDCFNLDGRSESAGPVMGRPGSIPGAPVDLEITEVRSGLRINWKSPGDVGGFTVSEYIIYRRSVDGEMARLSSVPGNTYQFIDETVEEGRIYFYSVSGKNIYGEGAKSDEASGKTSENREGMDAVMIFLLSIIMVLLLSVIVLASLLAHISMKKKDKQMDNEDTAQNEDRDELCSENSDIPNGDIMDPVHNTQSPSSEEPFHPIEPPQL
ncbi:MAG: fibronectin type III domain-containing protein [Thermoplasmatota archaeon]